MGKCKYCGHSAGAFRNKHKECESKYVDGKQQIYREIINFIKDEKPFNELKSSIEQIETASFIPESETKEMLVRGWECTINDFLEDGVLDEFEESRLMKFSDHFNLSNHELDAHGCLTKTVKAAVIRDILNGIVPERISNASSLPVNLQKNEKIVWAFDGTSLLEDKTRRQYVSGSRGVSVRIMKGVYYRVGAFKGHSIETTERVQVDSGWLIVTNKNIYFIGSRKSMRIPYKKIVSFDPYSDGIGIMRDSSNAKMQIFINGDGWFTYNVVSNLSQMYL